MHRPIRETMRAVSSREFTEWKLLFQEEDIEKLTRREKWEYYAAAIAYRITAANAASSAKLKFDDFFFDYQTPESLKQRKEKELNPEKLAEKKRIATLVSKMKWGAITSTPILRMDQEKRKSHG